MRFRRTPIIFLICFIAAFGALDSTAAQNELSRIRLSTLSEALTPDTEDHTETDEFDFSELDDIQADLKKTEAAGTSDSVTLSGYLQLEAAYSYLKPVDDFEFNRTDAEISKIKSNLYLSLDLRLSDQWKAKISGNGFYDFYYPNRGRDDFPSETLDAYEYELEFRDTYIEGPIWDALWLKFGRQIMAWGESDIFQIADIGNPRDNRELGQVDIEDFRIPVTATQLTYLLNGWELNAVAVHEIRANKIATQGSEFDNSILFRLPGTAIEKEITPDSSLDNTEWLLRIFKRFNRGDVSLMYADVVDDNAFLDLDPAALTFTPRHRRLKVLGAAGNLVLGSWLLKMEFAHKSGVALLNDNSFLQLQGLNLDQRNWSEHCLIEAMAGLDYSGISDLTVGLEVAWTHIEDYKENLLQDEDSFDIALTLDYDMLRDTLHPQFFWRRFSNDNGDVYRFSVTYDIRDALEVTAGIALYDAQKDGFIHPYRNSDNIYIGIRYSF